MITAGCKTLREIFETRDDTRSLAVDVDPCYKTASIFVKNKTWVKLDATECKAFFMKDRIPRGFHEHLDKWGGKLEDAMADRQI